VLVRKDPEPTLLMPTQPNDKNGLTTLVGSPTTVYSSFPHNAEPIPGSSSYQTQTHNNRWFLYVSLAVLLLLVVGGVTALVLFGLKFSKTMESGTNQSPGTQVASKPTVEPSPLPSPSPSPSPYTDKDLVGAWRSAVNEQGQRIEITVTFLQDGATRYIFKDARGQTSTYAASWRYADGILYERYPNGKSGRDCIRWLDRNDFELTIIDNGDRSSAGVKRRYQRITHSSGL